MSKARVAVIGGGIVGVTTAHALLDLYGNQLESVTILSEQWSPLTTGDVSAGYVFPYCVGNKTDPRLLESLFSASMAHLAELIKCHDSGGFGLSLATVYELYRDDSQREAKQLSSAMQACFPLYADLSHKELAMFGGDWTSGRMITTYMLEPRLFLPHLMQRFLAMGGKQVTRCVDELKPLLTQYDQVINCTGLGSRYLRDVEDGELIPVRGQVVRVEAPWIRHGVLAGHAYILVNNHQIILGGTKDRHAFHTQPNADVTKRILHDCAKLVPSLAQAKVIRVECGLRPFRDCIRIEPDPREPRIIHNYGHGGSGVTLAFGSAFKVVQMIYDTLLK